MLGDLLSTAQVARRLGLTRAAVCAAVKNGYLVPAFKMDTVNGAYFFTLEAVQRWRDERVERLTSAKVKRSVSYSASKTNGKTCPV